MDDEIESLLVQVRAGTQGFAQDMREMRTICDTTITEGFERAGQVLERGLRQAILRGSFGFEDLKRIALSVLADIAAQSLHTLIGAIGGLGGKGGGGDLGGILGAVLGLPGRATGGPVSPGRGYLVGERGPELFVPTSAGRVEPQTARPREVRVAIQVAAPASGSAPQALQRSSRQVASAVRRALSQY
jgi:hypothetical protein